MQISDYFLFSFFHVKLLFAKHTKSGQKAKKLNNWSIHRYQFDCLQYITQISSTYEKSKKKIPVWFFIFVVFGSNRLDGQKSTKNLVRLLDDGLDNSPFSACLPFVYSYGWISFVYRCVFIWIVLSVVCPMKRPIRQFIVCGQWCWSKPLALNTALLMLVYFFLSFHFFFQKKNDGCYTHRQRNWQWQQQ